MVERELLSTGQISYNKADRARSVCKSDENVLHAFSREIADLTAGKYNKEGADLLMTTDPLSLSFQSKGMKTDKLPAHVFEIDEDAKDEVSRRAQPLLELQTLIITGRMSGLRLTQALYGETAPCMETQLLVMCYKPF